MTWYSTLTDFALKQIAAIAPPEREEEYFDPAEADQGVNGSAFIATGAVHEAFVVGSRSFDSELSFDLSATDTIYEAFDASQPVAQPKDLCGREEELGRLLSGIIHRRNHGIVSGPRGSGKTSLVRVFGQHADREGIVVLYAACDSDTTFGELMRDFLEQIPASSIDPDEIELFNAKVRKFGADSTPHQATSLFAHIVYSQVVIVVDEFDRVEDRGMQSKIASLLKLISDARIPVRLVLVGVNSTFAAVVDQHPSLRRHLTRLSTAPLSQSAIFELLDQCAERCGTRITDDAKKLLNEVACGSPYHARLFGTHAALAARKHGAKDIGRQDVLTGFAEAFNEWATLNEEDAAAFRGIVEGSKGDPSVYAEVARQFAMSAEGQDGNRSLNARQEALLSNLDSAVIGTGDSIAFRDSTAPQYLVALDYISNRTKPARQSKERVVV